MGQIMTLSDIVLDLDDLDPEQTIYVREPWQIESEALVAYEPEDGGMPDSVRILNLSYFIEVGIAREFIQDWQASIVTQASLEQKIDRLIDYVHNDS